jgi:multidrug efflux pump subunit AcrB
MKSFNISEWALQHRSLVWYMMLVFIVAGVFSYQKLGREEDPSFTIKTMVVQATWPGATIDDTAQQITDRIDDLYQLARIDTGQGRSDHLAAGPQ